MADTVYEVADTKDDVDNGVASCDDVARICNDFWGMTWHMFVVTNMWMSTYQLLRYASGDVDIICVVAKTSLRQHVVVITYLSSQIRGCPPVKFWGMLVVTWMSFTSTLSTQKHLLRWRCQRKMPICNDKRCFSPYKYILYDLLIEWYCLRYYLWWL